MKNMFSYDSKFMQIALMLTDYLLLNILFLLCCIPVITIGAAQAALYSGLAVLRNPDDDSSCIRKFFEGFASGFGTITIIWSVSLVVMALMVYNLVAILVLDAAGAYAPIWVCAVGLAIFAVYQSMLTIFHSKFGCTVRQLLKNALFMILAHPIRSIAVAALTWLPVILFAFAFDVFMKNVLLMIIGYFSLVFSLNLSIMKKPFETIENSFYKRDEEETRAESEDSVG